jgi:hypothetical protein
MTGCLPSDEGAQLRFDFETEMARLEAASRLGKAKRAHVSALVCLATSFDCSPLDRRVGTAHSRLCPSYDLLLGSRRIDLFEGTIPGASHWQRNRIQRDEKSAPL